MPYWFFGHLNQHTYVIYMLFSLNFPLYSIFLEFWGFGEPWQWLWQLELNHFIVNEHRSASSTHSLREWNEDDVDVLVNARVSKPLLLLWGMVCHYNWFLCILFLKFSIRVVNLCFNQDNTFLFQSNIHNLICHVPVQLPSIGRGEICQDTGSWVPRHLFCF